ncbi:MAG TPA: tryptophan halogenase family protein [Povalibacter sp.]|nr:tryptophan halogenase family protein [Povalibacter sp.]
MTGSVDHVVIVGDDASAWLAAAALKQAFRHRALDVLVVESGAAPNRVGRWTLPSLRGLHARLGIRETDLLRRTDATFKLATEHCDWQGKGSRYLHAHGEIGTALSGTPFYKYLVDRTLTGHTEDAAEYSLAATAARAGRFARPMSTNDLTASFTYAFHLHEAAYTAYVREHALKLGVRNAHGRVAHVQISDARISSLQLEDGGMIDGEFFIDCSGVQGTLIDSLDDGGREDWSSWLVNDRMLSAQASAVADPPALTQTLAVDAGWLWQMPLARSRVVGSVYSSAFSSDDNAARSLISATGCAEPTLMKLQQGRRRCVWRGNCVAMGETAVQIEPLAGANLHVAELGIGLLIELFPLDGDSSLEAVEYNRIMGEFADSLRDFTLAHYRAGRLREGEYWHATRQAAPPERFAQRMDQFRAGARLEMLDHEIFEETDWAWVLLGSGCVPDALELHTRSTIAGARPETFAGLRTSILRLAGSMPRHIDYVQHQR